MEKDGENKLERQDVKHFGIGEREKVDNEHNYGEKKKVDWSHFERRRIAERGDRRTYDWKATKREETCDDVGQFTRRN